MNILASGSIFVFSFSKNFSFSTDKISPLSMFKLQLLKTQFFFLSCHHVSLSIFTIGLSIPIQTIFPRLFNIKFSRTKIIILPPCAVKCSNSAWSKATLSTFLILHHQLYKRNFQFLIPLFYNLNINQVTVLTSHFKNST